MAQPIPAASLIAALHARYEAAMSEYFAVEGDSVNVSSRAKIADRSDDTPRHDAALKTLDLEADALRNAILFQVPDTWSDALILQFHISCAQDMYSSASEPSDRDNERLQVAIDTLFDFMCAEVRTEVTSIGPSFADAANRIRLNRRLRTGVVEA